MSTVTGSRKRGLKYEKGLVRPKDTNAPKRPLSAYMQWAAENREDAKSKCGGTSSVTEITKMLGKMWGELPRNEKVKWELEAEAEMKKFKTKYAAYKSTKKYGVHEKTLREYNIKMTYKPFGRDPNWPKRVASAYMIYWADKRSEVVSQTECKKVSDVMKLLAKSWKNLSAEEKQPYITKAAKLATKYAKEVEKYKKTKEHAKYLEEKAAYQERMIAKRHRLMKQAGMEIPAGKGSGATPKAKKARRKTSEPKKIPGVVKKSPKKTPRKSPKKSSKKKTPSKKRSASKKKSSKSKKAQTKKSSKKKASKKK